MSAGVPYDEREAMSVEPSLMSHADLKTNALTSDMYRHVVHRFISLRLQFPRACDAGLLEVRRFLCALRVSRAPVSAG